MLKSSLTSIFKNKAVQFCMENLKMKRKRTKIFLTFRSGDLNPRFFSNFPHLDLNLRVTKSNLGNLLKEIGLQTNSTQNSNKNKRGNRLSSRPKNKPKFQILLQKNSSPPNLYTLNLSTVLWSYYCQL